MWIIDDSYISTFLAFVQFSGIWYISYISTLTWYIWVTNIHTYTEVGEIMYVL